MNSIIKLQHIIDCKVWAFIPPYTLVLKVLYLHAYADFYKNGRGLKRNN